VPKGDQDLFQNLTLSFRNKVISAMSILDSLGQTTVIEFKNVEHHEGVAKENFVLDLPDNVDVIEEGQ
jgi:outer membrane lipoprotein carrier protein